MTRRPNTEMTSTEKRVLDVYVRITERTGTPPSLSELAAACSDIELSRSGAAHALGRLRDKGYLTERKITIVRPKLTAKARKRTA